MNKTITVLISSDQCQNRHDLYYGGKLGWKENTLFNTVDAFLLTLDPSDLLGNVKITPTFFSSALEHICFGSVHEEWGSELF